MWDSNPHGPFGPNDFKSFSYTDSDNPANSIVFKENYTKLYKITIKMFFALKLYTLFTCPNGSDPISSLLLKKKHKLGVDHSPKKVTLWGTFKPSKEKQYYTSSAS